MKSFTIVSNIAAIGIDAFITAVLFDMGGGNATGILAGACAGIVVFGALGRLISIIDAIYLDAKGRECPHWNTRCDICGKDLGGKRG